MDILGKPAAVLIGGAAGRLLLAAGCWCPFLPLRTLTRSCQILTAQERIYESCLRSSKVVFGRERKRRRRKIMYR